MKLTIAGYEVEIKAKKDYKDRFNKADTEAFLNHLSLLLAHSETHDTYMEREAKEVSYKIYDTLDNIGVYDKIRNW